MYKKILVPVDLSHVERLDKALTTAADLSKHYGIPICYVGITTSQPSAVAHTPTEFAQKMEHFGKAQADKHGVDATTITLISHDPIVDLDNRLITVIDKTDSDLVVMASHIPGLVDHIFASNAGYLAAHAKVSVLVVR